MKWFNAKWSEEKQRSWVWGFLIGYILTNIGYGIGWLIVKSMGN